MVADRLAARHFTAQGQLPPELAGVELDALDPFLRNLLLTDGTVSRALEAHTLRPVDVEPVEQSEAPAPSGIAASLRPEPGERCLRRRVVMRIAGPEPSVWAESWVVPSRVPGEFLRALREHRQGIGGTLEQLKLESWRELLWFGLSAPPSWPEASRTERTLRRAYLILIGRRPALLISEDFGLCKRDGRWSLAGTEGDGSG